MNVTESCPVGHNSDSDVMGTRVGGMLLTQVRSPPHWLTLKGAPNRKLGSPDGGQNLAKNAKNQKTRGTQAFAA